MVNTNHNAISYVGHTGNSARFRPLTPLSMNSAQVQKRTVQHLKHWKFCRRDNE